MTVEEIRKASKPHSTLKNLQALRAFAALAVVLYHTRFIFPHMYHFGSFGVDIFFVISGYIMTGIVERNSTFFLRRRLLRIVPPYWFFTVLLYSVGRVSPRVFHATRVSYHEFLKSMLFIPHLKPLEGGGSLIEPLLGVGWTLCFEMLFYLSLAVGLLISKRRAVLIGGTIVVLSHLICSYFASKSVIATFYSSSVIFEFIFGVIAYYFCCAISERNARRFRVGGLVVCIANALALIAIEGLMPRPILVALPRALVFGLPSLFMITCAATLYKAKWDTNIWFFVLLGDASYMLYLLHFFSLYGIDRILAVHWGFLKIDTPLGAFIGISVSVFAAIALHTQIERPFLGALQRRFGGKRATTARIEAPVSAL
jgi:exopolysaccharide production protein ExoZ